MKQQQHHRAARVRTRSESMRVPGIPAEALEGRILLSGGPRVTSSDLRPGAQTVGFVGGLYLRFDRPVRSVGPEDLQLTADDNPGVVIPARSAAFDHNATELYFAYDNDVARSLPLGAYTLRLLSGDGRVEGVDGADLDGEMPASGELPSGDGSAGGDFVLHFTVVAGNGFGLPPALVTAHPLSDREIEVGWYSDVHINYGFEVERADGDGPFEMLRRFNWNGRGACTYLDSTVQPGHVYHYRVRMFEHFNGQPGYSEYSDVASSEVLPPSLALPVTSVAAQAAARPDWLTEVGGDVYFTWASGPHATAWNSATGTDLWRTDGTPAGTTRLFAGGARELIDVNGTLFFAGRDPAAGDELWTSDGTADGTGRVKDIAAGAASSSPRMLGVLGASLLFGLPKAGDGYELWRSDGTASGTARVTDQLVYLEPVPDAASTARRLFNVIGGHAYFRGATAAGTDALSLWRTDGTAAGTAQVPGVQRPAWLTEFSGDLLFAATSGSANPDGDTTRGLALWRYDPDTGAVRKLANVESGWAYGWLTDLTVVGGAAYFSGETRGLGVQFWRSDGTAAGTAPLGSVNTQISGPRQYGITGVGGRVYFVNTQMGDTPFPGLNYTDGTVAGTRHVRRHRGFWTESPRAFLSVAGKLIYTDGADLWQSDGTLAGSTKIERIGVEADERFDGYGFSGPAVVAVGDRVFFSASVPDGGRELRVAALTPPAAPSGVTTGGDGGALAWRGPSPAGEAAGGVTVRWADNAANESGYAVERLSSPTDPVPDAAYFAPPGATSVVDPTAPAGGAFVYRVRSYNAAGYSPAAFSGGPTGPVTVVGRHVFYNNSAFDAGAAGDDGAIASGKQALRPGGAASAANVTSYSKGINGVMIDVDGLAVDGASLLAADLTVRAGAGGTDPATWAAAPAPTLTVRPGAGANGSDRVVLTWSDGAIVNKWLQVTVPAGGKTGLAAADVFSFGNLVGDADGSRAVNLGDFGALRADFGRTNLVLADGRSDFNRDGAVNLADFGLLRGNFGGSLGVPTMSTAAPAGARAAAEAAGIAPSTAAAAVLPPRKAKTATRAVLLPGET